MAVKTQTPTFESLRGLPEKTPSFESVRKTPSFEKLRSSSVFSQIKNLPKISAKGLARGGEGIIGGMGSVLQWVVDNSPLAQSSKAFNAFRTLGKLKDPKVSLEEKKKLGKKFVDDTTWLAEKASAWKDWWDEQANKGWEAPDPEIMKAKWSEKPIEKAAQVISEGVPLYATAFASSVITKNPKVGLMFMSAISGGESYHKQREKDVNKLTANAIATLTASWEYVTEKISFEILMKPGKSVVTKMLKLGTAEGAQEFFQGRGENFLEHFGYNIKDWETLPAAVKEGTVHAMDGWAEDIIGGVGLGIIGGGVSGSFLGDPTPQVQETNFDEQLAELGGEAVPRDDTKRPAFLKKVRAEIAEIEQGEEMPSLLDRLAEMARTDPALRKRLESFSTGADLEDLFNAAIEKIDQRGIKEDDKAIRGVFTTTEIAQDLVESNLIFPLDSILGKYRNNPEIIKLYDTIITEALERAGIKSQFVSLAKNKDVVIDDLELTPDQVVGLGIELEELVRNRLVIEKDAQKKFDLAVDLGAIVDRILGTNLVEKTLKPLAQPPAQPVIEGKITLSDLDTYHSTVVTEPVETRSPAKIFADRIIEGVRVHETEIKSAQKKERARRAPLIAAERDRLRKAGVPRHEAIQQAFEKFGKGKLTDRQVFDPLWDKVDSEALFKELDSLDYKIYDQKSAFNAVKSVLDGNAPTEGQAKMLGDIYGFEVRSALDQRIASNKALNAIEKLREGKPLTLEEVSLIGRYYPNLAKLAWDAVPRMDKFIPYLKQIWFLRRTLKLGSDISLWMRQAKAEVLLHPIIATRAMIRSFKAYGIPFMENSRNKAENFTRQSVKMTKDMPHYEEAKAASINAYELPPMGVPIIEAEGLEWYKGGEMAERLPFIGHFVRAGQRAWIAGSNYFHMAKYAHDRQIFEDKEGNVTEKQARQLAAQVNTQLGRTHLPKSGLTTTAQNVMLAPGFAASRFTNFVLPLRPLIQHDMDAVKLSYLSTKAWAAFIGSNLILLSALKWMFGDEAEIDDEPTSNNYGKWRIGNTRGDVWAGFAQPARLSIQLFMATKGIKRTTSAGRKRKVEAKDLIAKFGRSKSSFLVGGIVDAYTGQTYTGKPFPPKKRKEQLGMTLEAFTPMWIMDMVDAMVQDGVAMGLIAGGGSFLGEGFASYEEAKGVTLQKYEDEVAIKKYEKPYESLTPREQFTLYEQYPDLKLLKMESESKRENIPNLNRMVKKQRAVGDRILKSLPKDVSDSLISVGLKSNRLGLSRSWQRRKKSFYLNDDRYEWYEKRVIEKLNRPGTLKRLRRIEQTYVPLRKEKEFMRRIDMVKEEARDELGLLMSRHKI